jgi:hypothetical protein
VIAMNHNVDDYSGIYRNLAPDDDTNIYNNKDEPPATIISRIKSLFDHPDHALVPTASIPCQLSDPSLLDIPNQAKYSHPHFLNTDNTWSCTTTSTHRFSDVKRILTDFPIPNRQLHATSTNSHFRIDSNGSVSGQSDTSQSHTVSSPLTSPNTPPLSPDSFNGLALSPLISSSGIPEQCQYPDSQDQNSHQTGIHIQEDYSQHIRRHSRSLDIKQGKKPQRPIVRVYAYFCKLNMRAASPDSVTTRSSRI